MTKVTLICTLCILAALFITKRKELPIYECYSPMMGKAQCDLDTKLSDERDVGSRRMLDIFRECKTLFVQGEAESMSRFMQRIPADSARPCLVLRKSGQDPRNGIDISTLKTKEFVTIIGAFLDGNSPEEP